jgi:hypothetical protein
VVIEIEIRDGRIASIATEGLVAGVGEPIVDVITGVEFFPQTGDEAPAASDAFSACATARRATRELGRLAYGRSLEAAFEIHVGDVMKSMGYVPRENERCVLTALGALRSALIDAHVTALAEATVEAKRLRPK